MFGQELGFIIEGTAEFSIGARKYPLEEGDSISFSSDAPHRLVNTGTGLLRAFWAVTPRGESKG
jgi:quercetin dioxygenase-like cupin family protein